VNVDGPDRSIIICREVSWLDREDDCSRGQKRPVDRAYHEARELAETKAADGAGSAQSRRIHRELAEAHSKMAGGGGGRPRRQ
jgi:hypothetical protein